MDSKRMSPSSKSTSPSASKSPSPSSSRSHSRSPGKVRSPPREAKRKKSSSGKHLKAPIPKPPVHYGSSYSWDAAQGQALMDKVTALGERTYSSSSLSPMAKGVMEGSSPKKSKDTPYLALVQLFNQFQGMPVDTKKTLINVSVLGSTGPIRMLVTSDATVKDVIKLTLLKYAHEGRVPALGRSTRVFDLYDSQFSSQELKHEDRVAELGTRNFVLCPKNMNNGCGGESNSSSARSKSSWWSYVTGIKSLV